jgi:spermidine synthase
MNRELKGGFGSRSMIEKTTSTRDETPRLGRALLAGAVIVLATVLLGQARADGGKVLARSKGRSGLIEVVERGGQRYLLINKVVQAVVSKSPHRRRTDVLADVVRGVRPGARSALIIGLGGGNTAMAFRQIGCSVTAVELECKVIEYARAYFGYRGKAVCADGLQHLKRTPHTFDVIVLDAFVGKDVPGHLISTRAFRIIKDRLRPGGLIAVRLLAPPGGRVARTLLSGLAGVNRAMRQAKRYAAIFQHMTLGSGTGREEQNLIVLASRAPLGYFRPGGVPLWPVALRSRDGSVGDHLEPVPYPDTRESRIVRKGRAKRIRRAVVVGYLSVVGGEVVLDLPPMGMGHLRIVLRGRLARQLKARAARAAASGHAGRTGLVEVVGSSAVVGARWNRSPLAAAIEGEFRLMCWTPGVSKVGTRGKPRLVKRLLPFGGALYRMKPSKVHWTLTARQWARFRRGKLSRLERQLRRETDARRRRTTMERILALLRGRFGEAAEALHVYRRYGAEGGPPAAAGAPRTD